MGEECVKYRTQDTTRRGSSSYSQGGRDALSYSDLLGAVHEEVHEPCTLGGAEAYVIQLSDQFVGDDCVTCRAEVYT